MFNETSDTQLNYASCSTIVIKLFCVTPAHAIYQFIMSQIADKTLCIFYFLTKPLREPVDIIAAIFLEPFTEIQLANKMAED